MMTMLRFNTGCNAGVLPVTSILVHSFVLAFCLAACQSTDSVVLWAFSIQVTRDYKLEVNWDSKLEATVCVLHNTTHCRVGAAGGCGSPYEPMPKELLILVVALKPTHRSKEFLDLSAQGHGPFMTHDPSVVAL